MAIDHSNESSILRALRDLLPVQAMAGFAIWCAGPVVLTVLAVYSTRMSVLLVASVLAMGALTFELDLRRRVLLRISRTVVDPSVMMAMVFLDASSWTILKRHSPQDHALLGHLNQLTLALLLYCMYLVLGALYILPNGMGLLAIPFLLFEAIGGLSMGAEIPGHWHFIRQAARIGLAVLWLSGWIAWIVTRFSSAR